MLALSDSINTYDPTTGLIHQDLTHANEAAWGGGSGNFVLNNKGLMEGKGVNGLSTAESV